MTDYFNQKANRVIRNTKIIAWIGIIYEFINLLLLIIYGNKNKYGIENIPLDNRLFMIFFVCIGGLLFINSCNKLSRQIAGIISYPVFELKYFIRIICPYFQCIAITLVVTSLDDPKTVFLKTFQLSMLILLAEIIIRKISKYMFKKELFKQKTNNPNI